MAESNLSEKITVSLGGSKSPGSMAIGGGRLFLGYLGGWRVGGEIDAVGDLSTQACSSQRLFGHGVLFVSFDLI